MRGATNSGKRGKMTLKAIEDQNKNLDRLIAQTMHGGYESATKASQEHKNRQLAAGELASQAGTSDLVRKMESGRLLQGLNTDEQANLMKNLSFMNEKGTQEQATHQNALNQEYSDFLRQKEYPHEQARRFGEIIHKLPASTQTAAYMPTVQQPSPFTQAGGMVANLFANSQMKAVGGRVTMDNGGLVGGSYGSGNSVMDGLDTMARMKQHADELEARQNNPMWGYLANMGAGIASSKNPNVWGAMGESVPHASQGYQDVLAGNKANKSASLAIREAIDKSRQTQMERQEKFSHEIELEKLKQAGRGIRKTAAERMAEYKMGKDFNLKPGEDIESFSPEELAKKEQIQKNKAVMAKSEPKRYEAMKEEHAKTSDALREYKRAKALSPHLGFTQVGGIKMPEIVSQAADVVMPLAGYEPGSSEARNAFNSIMGEQLATITASQKGAQSDYDIKNWEKMLASTEKSEKGRERILNAKIAILERAEKMTPFVESMMKEGMTLSDAESAWHRYVNANPLFDDMGSLKADSGHSPEEYLEGSAMGGQKPVAIEEDTEVIKTLPEADKSKLNDAAKMEAREILKKRGVI
jgi:hypothetical protein